MSKQKGPAEGAEEEYEDYDYEEDDAPPLPRAFAVGGEPDFESGPPATAEEYLRRVRWEAQRCQQVVVSAIDPRKFDHKQTQYMPAIDSATPTPSNLLPSREWEDSFAAIFSDMRLELAGYAGRLAQTAKTRGVKPPAKKDKSAWRALVFGAEAPEDDTEQRVATTAADSSVDSSPVPLPHPPSGLQDQSPLSAPSLSTEKAPAPPILPARSPPLLTLVAQMDQVATRTVLTVIIDAVTVEGATVDSATAQWLFALLVKLDKPVHAEIAAGLRGLYRALAQHRTKLTEGATALAEHNILLTVIERCFQQKI